VPRFWLISGAIGLRSVHLHKPKFFPTLPEPRKHLGALGAFCKVFGFQAEDVDIGSPMVPAAPGHRAVQQDVTGTLHRRHAHGLRSIPLAVPDGGLVAKRTGRAQCSEVDAVACGGLVHAFERVTGFGAKEQAPPRRHVAGNLREGCVRRRIDVSQQFSQRRNGREGKGAGDLLTTQR